MIIKKEIINKIFGCNRLVYNHYLDKKINNEANKQSLSCYDCIKDLKNLQMEYLFLKEVDNLSLRCSLSDLDNPYQKFFKEHAGYLKFISKFNKNSYRSNMITSSYIGKTYYSIKLNLENNTITLPKLKNVKIRGYRNLDKKLKRIINATISRDLDNKYYVSVVVEEEIINPEFNPTTIVGLDLGIKDLVITSDFFKYQNEKAIENMRKESNKNKED